MSRGLILLVLLSCSLSAETIWDEVGLKSTEKITIGGHTLNLWRFNDSTGALAGLHEIAAEPGKANASQIGNFVVLCEGKCPPNLVNIVQARPHFNNAPLPVLRTYTPTKSLVARSERYILGPVGLSENAPQIPASAAAFQFGTEAVVARYRVLKDEPTLGIFMYLTPQMARKQLSEFEKISGATAKRSGPLIGVVLNEPDPKAADRLLQEIVYQASMSWDQQPPLIIRPQTAAQIVLGGMELAGFILVFCLFSGLAFGGYKFLRQRIGPPSAAGALIVLHLGDK